jgi:hypothetical protein
MNLETPMRPSPLVPLAIAVLVLSACGGNTTAPHPPASTASGATMATVGDVSIRASALQTSTLDATVARQYGIARDPRSVLLLVAVRQGPQGRDTALPATITATVTDLRGRRQPIAMREVRTGELVDYIGVADTTLPDTLRFDIHVVRTGGATSTVQLRKDVYPQ